jgi:hypothetical protein
MLAGIRDILIITTPPSRKASPPAGHWLEIG